MPAARPVTLESLLLARTDPATPAEARRHLREASVLLAALDRPATPTRDHQLALLTQARSRMAVANAHIEQLIREAEAVPDPVEIDRTH
jgi:hypothetical protein